MANILLSALLNHTTASSGIPSWVTDPDGWYYLTATVINLKRLAAAVLVLINILWRARALDDRHAEPQPA